jgi:sigma-B regulation protein RsbU (phosphoserine phosphatase)
MIEPRRGKVRLLNAGHVPPVLVRGGRCEEVPPVNRALGLFPGAAYKEQQVELEPGEALLLYSDGITEARNGEGDFFGEDRLLTLLSRMGDRSADDTAAYVRSEVDRFVGEEPYSDDLSLILLRRVSE